MREIQLTQNQIAIVPDEWFEELNKHLWCAQWQPRANTFYAARNVKKSDECKGPWIWMHRVILNAPHGVEVDHIDGNGLNNFPPNIRLAHGTGNKRNRTISRNSKSGFKGVYWCKNVNRWRVKISVDGNMIHVGLYDELLEAAKAYNEVAMQYFGEFAWLNNLNGNKTENGRPLFSKPQGASRRTSSGYKGVCWNKKLKQWKSYVYLHGATINAGHSKNILDAVRATNNAVLKHCGKSAYQNEILEDLAACH